MFQESPCTRRNAIAIAAMAGLALGLLLLRSLYGGHLGGIDEYDDGVYFGSSLELIHGLLPYRDFVFIQPPMVSILLSPFAALSLLSGTAPAFEAARIFIDIVAGANVVMVGLLVRRRSTLQVLVSTGAMALYPGMLRSAQTVLLEPLVVFLCLAGLLFLFDGDDPRRSPWRIVLAGVLFGLAGATKLWAVLPFLALVWVLLAAGPRRCGAFILAGAAGFIAVSAPFIIGSPGGFFRQVFVVQAVRNANGYSPSARLADLSGLPGVDSLVDAPGSWRIVLLAVVLALLVAVCVLAFAGPRRRPASPLERFVLAATVLSAGVLFVAPVYYYHYSGFAAAFVALLYGAVAGRLAERSRDPARTAVSGRARRRPPAKVVAALATVVPVVLLCAMFGVRVGKIVSSAPARTLREAVSNVIPAQGCVFSTNASVVILDDRFTADRPGCPHMIDILGEERVLDHGRSQTASDARDRATQVTYMRWVRASEALVIRTDPEWGAAVRRYVRRHFHLAWRSTIRFSVYLRRKHPIPPGSA